MNFTHEQMSAAIKFAKETGVKELDRLEESVRMMRFYGFIDEATCDAFYEEWKLILFPENRKEKKHERQSENQRKSLRTLRAVFGVYRWWQVVS